MGLLPHNLYQCLRMTLVLAPSKRRSTMDDTVEQQELRGQRGAMRPDATDSLHQALRRPQRAGPALDSRKPTRRASRTPTEPLTHRIMRGPAV
jgi:hypothetical protein